MKDLIEIKIPLKVPSLNVLLRLHWSARSKLKAQWGLFIRRPVDPVYFKKITIIGMQKRLYDYDNFVGGCKELVVDNLRHKNWIKDDNIKNVKIEYLQMKSKKDELIIQFKKEDAILDVYKKEIKVTVSNTDKSSQIPIGSLVPIPMFIDVEFGEDWEEFCVRDGMRYVIRVGKDGVKLINK